MGRREQGTVRRSVNAVTGWVLSTYYPTLNKYFLFQQSPWKRADRDSLILPFHLSLFFSFFFLFIYFLIRFSFPTATMYLPPLGRPTPSWCMCFFVLTLTSLTHPSVCDKPTTAFNAYCASSTHPPPTPPAPVILIILIIMVESAYFSMLYLMISLRRPKIPHSPEPDLRFFLLSLHIFSYLN